MNKDLLDQIPAEEQPVGSKLNLLVENMHPSRALTGLFVPSLPHLRLLRDQQ